MLKKILRTVVTLLLTAAIFLPSVPVMAAENTSLVWEYANVKKNESEYDAFLRLGKSFYKNYIKGKYSSGKNNILTLESVYAFEYALNKDILSDETVNKLTKNKIVVLGKYAQQVNCFCASMLQETYKKRSANGTTAPDFDKLTLLGYDLYGCQSAPEYLTRYAVLDRYALWSGEPSASDPNELVNSAGNPVLGWVRLPDGKITLQLYGSYSDVTRVENWSKKYFVLSDDRYYCIEDRILAEDPTLNFAEEYEGMDVSWWETQIKPEDKTFTLKTDKYRGATRASFEKQLGKTNMYYFNSVETFRYIYTYAQMDFGLPYARTKEYSKTHTLVNKGESNITLSALGSAKLNIAVKKDSAKWYANHLYYSSSNPDVAAVDNNGTVYAVSKGEAVITVVTKSSGRSKPVQIKVTVKDSPDITVKQNIGYVLEDSLFDLLNRGVNFDSLADKLTSAGGSSVVLCDQPMFCVNGKADFTDEELINGKLTLEHELDNYKLDTITIEDYKTLAAQAHKKGIKVYMYIQCVWQPYGGMARPDCYYNLCLERYAQNPDDAEAKAFVDKLFNAYKEYWNDIAPKLQKAGVDGIYILHSANGQELLISDSHWPELIEAVRKVYDGEIIASYHYLDHSGGRIINNEALYSNADSIVLNCQFYENDFPGRDLSLEKCREIVDERFASLADRLYEKYGKPVHPYFWLSSTDIITSSGADSSNGIGKYITPDGQTANADYLQQMIVWEAVMECFADRGYVGSILSYYQNGGVCGDFGTHYDSGFEGRATVYKKPASKLLKAWANIPTKAVEKQADYLTITKVGGKKIYDRLAFVDLGTTVSITNSAPKGTKYRWYSSDPGVAEVSSTGKITARSAGIVTIKAYDKYGAACDHVNVVVRDTTHPTIKAVYSAADKFADKLRKAGQTVSLDIYNIIFELAVRINSECISEAETKVIAAIEQSDGITGREYSTAVYNFSQNSAADLTMLVIPENVTNTCKTGADFLHRYAVKDSSAVNYYKKDEGYIPQGENVEIYFNDGTPLIGWYDSGWGDDWIFCQYPDENGKLRTYFSNCIHTGNKFFFCGSNSSWTVQREITLDLIDGYKTIRLDSDYGISEERLRREIGEETYKYVEEALNSGGEYSFFSDGMVWQLVHLDVGYPA